jgi:hypothetical protein
MIRTMAGATGNGLQLGAEHATLIQGAVSIVVSTRDADLVPDVMRGCGCRLTRDRRRVSVLVEPARSGAVLDHIRANGMIAVVFSQPSTHRTLQLKGSDATVAPAGRADFLTARQHLTAWVEDMQRIGYPATFARAVRGEPTEILVITFTPLAAFEQTPGPAAGQPLPA